MCRPERAPQTSRNGPKRRKVFGGATGHHAGVMCTERRRAQPARMSAPMRPKASMSEAKRRRLRQQSWQYEGTRLWVSSSSNVCTDHCDDVAVWSECRAGHGWCRDPVPRPHKDADRGTAALMARYGRGHRMSAFNASRCIRFSARQASAGRGRLPELPARRVPSPPSPPDSPDSRPPGMDEERFAFVRPSHNTGQMKSAGDNVVSAQRVSSCDAGAGHPQGRVAAMGGGGGGRGDGSLSIRAVPRQVVRTP